MHGYRAVLRRDQLFVVIDYSPASFLRDSPHGLKRLITARGECGKKKKSIDLKKKPLLLRN